MKSAWKHTALQRQLKYKQHLGITASGTHGGKLCKHILSDVDASHGANYYCHSDPQEWKRLREWAEQDKGKNVNFQGEGLKNLLRSEHIPYNLFYPLVKTRSQHSNLLHQFMEQLFQNHLHVDKVHRIKIEFASTLHKSKLLDDNTSFDAYIEYQDGAMKCGLGIEVKYTEKSYPYGATEKKRMFDEDHSLYKELTRRSGIYKSKAILALREKKLKQAWRNHLLGLRLVELGEVDQFHSVHLYPNGNSYQKEVCTAYLECLKDEHKHSFIPITFEKFNDIAGEIFTDPEHIDWIKYLRLRY